LRSLRGQDAVAVESVHQCRENRYGRIIWRRTTWGQSLVLVGQPDKAAEALERATRTQTGAGPTNLEVFQALGRVYQRAQKNDKGAGKVWNRLEKQFPNTTFECRRQIATTLLEENEFAARPAPVSKNLRQEPRRDKYRQSLFQMEAAEIKVRLGKSAESNSRVRKVAGPIEP